LESLVLNVIRRSINPIIIEEQHGFRPGRSTVTCNLIFNNFIYNSFQQRSQVDVIYTDFHKAFDSVNHDVLIQILIASGFGEPLLSRFKSFLVDRYQWVSLFNFKSTLYQLYSGAPQVGHLPPILFNNFINIIGSALHHCRFLCFADDVKLFMQIDSNDDCLKLQSDIYQFVELFDKLNLSLNIFKCKVMTFTRSRTSLVFPYHLRDTVISRCYNFIMDLGFKFTSNLDPSLLTLK